MNEKSDLQGFVNLTLALNPIDLLLLECFPAICPDKVLALVLFSAIKPSYH